MNTSTSYTFQPISRAGMQSNWYVVYTMPHHEKKIYAQLQKEGINAYLPLQTTLKQWRDRKKKVNEPLFRSYLFVHINMNEYYKVLNRPGVIRYVCFEGKAVKVPETKIEAIQNLLDNKVELEESPTYLKKGDKVRIMGGILQGFNGELVLLNNQKRVIIRIEEINKSLFVNVPINFLKLVG
jgi:transcription antitermination factor NusG